MHFMHSNYPSTFKCILSRNFLSFLLNLEYKHDSYLLLKNRIMPPIYNIHILYISTSLVDFIHLYFITSLVLVWAFYNLLIRQLVCDSHTPSIVLCCFTPWCIWETNGLALSLKLIKVSAVLIDVIHTDMVKWDKCGAAFNESLWIW